MTEYDEGYKAGWQDAISAAGLRVGLLSSGPVEVPDDSALSPEAVERAIYETPPGVSEVRSYEMFSEAGDLRVGVLVKAAKRYIKLGKTREHVYGKLRRGRLRIKDAGFPEVFDTEPRVNMAHALDAAFMEAYGVPCDQWSL